MFKTLRAVIWALALVVVSDNLADFSARATREGIAFQKEMMRTQLQRLFAPHEHEEE